MGEEILKLRISCVLFWSNLSFDEYLPDIVIENLLGDPTKELEGMTMALNEGEYVSR